MMYLKREKQCTETIKNLISRVDTLTARVVLSKFHNIQLHDISESDMCTTFIDTMEHVATAMDSITAVRLRDWM